MSEKKIKINFNLTNIRNLPTPFDKRMFYYDKKVPGLAIIVFPKTGTKTFVLYKRVNGRPTKVKLGRFPEMSPERAVKAAYRDINMIADGLNPNKIKREVRDETIFEALFQRYMEEHAKVRKSSWATDQRYYDRYLIVFKSKKISNIERTEVEKLHNKIKEVGGLYAANRVLALLSKVFNKAIDWGFKGLNPATRIKKFQEQSRDRALQPHEIGSFFEALNNEPNLIFRAYIHMSLVTGARRSNMLSMRWDQISYGENVEWKIPVTKNGEAYILHVVPQAVEILNELKKLSKSEWVFPSATSKSGHIEEPKRFWQRILAQAGIKDLRIHDLRRTLASWQVRTGASSFVIGKTLGHKNQQATAIYARVSKDVTKESMENAVNAMFEYSCNK